MKLANDPIQEALDWNGIPIDIEWPKGSVREYPDDETGIVTFRKQMYVDYGYIRDTDTADGEEVDVYVGNSEDALYVYVIDQLVVPKSYEEEQGETAGEHDEWKYMLGFSTMSEAEKAYELHMTEDHFGGIMPLPTEEFVELIQSGAASG